MKGRGVAMQAPETRPRSSGVLQRVAPSSAAVAAAMGVLAIVLVVDPTGLAPFGPSKWAVATTGVLAVAAATAHRGRLRVARLPTLVFLGLLLWTAVTAATGLDPLYAWIGTPERHWGVLAWSLILLAFVAGQAMRSRDTGALTVGTALAAGLAGLWATAELLGWQPFDVMGGSGRPGGPFGSSAYLGALAVLTVPLALALTLDRSPRAAARATAAAGAGLGGVALIGSGARAAWGGAVVAAVLWAALRRRSVRGRRQVVWITAVVGVAVVVIGLATGVAHRASDLATDERGGVRGRLDEWRVAARVVRAHPFVGVGPEGYRIAFADAVDEDYEQAHGRNPLPDRAHSAVLDVAAANGVPGAVGYLALLGILGVYLVRGIRGSDHRVTAAAVGVIGYFAQSLVLFPVPELDVVAWLLAGMVVGATTRTDEVRALYVPRLVPVALALFAVVALVAGLLDVAADRSAARALGGASSAEADRAMRLRPDALRYRLASARAHEATGTLVGLDTSLERLRQARRLSPRDPVVGAETGRLLLERARRTDADVDIDRARAHLESLLRADPHNAEVLLRLGLACALDGDDAAAEGAWLAAEGLAPRSAAASTNLALAYARMGRTDDARAAAQRALQRDPASERAHDVLRTVDGT